MDLSRQKLDPALVARAAVVAVYLPMHTATRLALPIIDRVRALNPRCGAVRLWPLRAAERRTPSRARRDARARAGVRSRSPGGGRRAAPAAGDDRAPLPRSTTARRIPRLTLIQPDRSGLPEPGSLRDRCRCPMARACVTGSTDATRGCKHRCRHCPIVPVYDGQFRVVPVDVVLADIRGQVEQGARHITFGDPGLLQRADARAHASSTRFRREWPTVTYDVTIKVEHLLRHRDLLPMLAADRLPVRDERGGVGGRSRAGDSWRKGTPAPTSSRPRRCAARPG